jgi:hypothetical protein
VPVGCLGLPLLSMNQPVGGMGCMGAHIAATQRAIQMVQQSNRANQQLILSNQRRMRYFTLPQSDLDLPPVSELIDDLGLELERTFTIRQHRLSDDFLVFEVQIDGKQTSLRLGTEREAMLLQCLLEIGDAESKD